MKKHYDRYTIEQRHEYQMKYYHKKMAEARQKFGNRCLFCGWNGVPEVLEFAHKFGTIKKFSIGNIMRHNKELIDSELEKCILLCPTCHSVYDYKNRLESRKVGVLDALEKREVEQPSA